MITKKNTGVGMYFQQKCPVPYDKEKITVDKNSYKTIQLVLNHNIYSLLIYGQRH